MFVADDPERDAVPALATRRAVTGGCARWVSGPDPDLGERRPIGRAAKTWLGRTLAIRTDDADVVNGIACAATRARHGNAIRIGVTGVRQRGRGLSGQWRRPDLRRAPVDPFSIDQWIRPATDREEHEARGDGSV
jgi:hypothetical protein